MDRILFDKKPCSKAGHASCSTRTIVRVYIAIKDNLSLKLNISISESDLCSGIVL